MSSGPSSSSPLGLQLCVDLSSYPLQQLSSSDPSTPWAAAHQHPMVLRSRLPKTALLAASTTASTAPNCRVLSSPTCEPLTLFDADRYEAWHCAMRDELQALHFNHT